MKFQKLFYIKIRKKIINHLDDSVLGLNILFLFFLLKPIRFAISIIIKFCIFLFLKDYLENKQIYSTETC